MTIAGQLQDYLRNSDVIYSFEGMVINKFDENYSFLDFQVNLQQRTVTQNNQTINLSKKSFDILAFLLQRHGVLITKDELLAAVWPKQFITDSALNKQIARLRQIFDAADSTASIIETVRGVGIRLMVPVQDMQNQEKNSIPNSPNIKHILAALLLLVVGFFFYQFFTTPKPVKIDQPEIKVVEPLKTYKESINIAIVPAQKTDEWLDIGGLNYLSELLQKHDEIDTISPQTQWFENIENNVLALQLSQAENIDYALIINNVKLKEQFVANITLRNKHGILATGELQSANLSKLFEKLDSWVILQLNITSGVVFSKEAHQSQISDFALESYLRGLAAARNDNYKQAKHFLNVAISQDKNLFDAWFVLIEIEAQQGNHQKALSIATTVENFYTFNKSLLNDFYNAKALVLINLNKLDEAESLIKKSIELSEEKQDMKAIIKSLTLQLILHEKRGNMNDQSLDIILRQFELVKKFNPLPNLVAKLNHNIAIIYQDLFKLDLAQKHMLKAAQQFERTGNKTGLFSSYRTLSSIYNMTAQLEKEKLALEKVEGLIKTIDSPSLEIFFYLSKAKNLYQQGFHKLAIENIDKSLEISIKISSNQFKGLALLVFTQMQIDYGEIEGAKVTTEKLLDLVFTNPKEYPSLLPYIIVNDMYLTAKFDKPEPARAKIKNYIGTYPELKNDIDFELRRIEAHILSKEGFRNDSVKMLQGLLDDYLHDGQISDAIFIGYEILDLQWQNDMDGYLKTINRVQEYTTFDYPILKYRAKYFAYKNDFLNAAILMQELKPKARDFWTANDQLLMEEFQQKAQNIGVIENI